MPLKTKRTINSRDWRTLEPTTLLSGVYDAFTTPINSNNNIESADLLHAGLQKPLVQHLPLQTRTISQRPDLCSGCLQHCLGMICAVAASSTV
ncbi:hypothetical protein ElyMa_002114700 [Elysia marginata]|uniref:Uncharacterized protein n=1 Tax=Elysia marginata TaxID=1093978 RepID=A0AAV4FGW7_9GAST|nr:hypothetical protein ElyMa_002114700 [Elysia marginata]